MLSDYDFSLIRSLRKEKHYSLRQFARKCGLTLPTVLSLENGKGVPSLNSLSTVAEALGFSLHHLLQMCQRKKVRRNTATLVEKSSWAPLAHVKNGRYINCGKMRLFWMKVDPRDSLDSTFEHSDFVEVCCVLSGELAIHIDHQTHRLVANETLHFDASSDHSYQFLEPCELLLLHLPKDSRMTEGEEYLDWLESMADGVD